jgi:hypothetical protein
MNQPKDLPRDELMQLADETLKRYPGATVHFKFTCGYCGHRCMLSDPNTLWENGECDECGRTSPITQGGFSLWLNNVAMPNTK